MEKEFLHQELEVAQAGADIKEGSRGGRVGRFFTTSFFSASILLTIGAVAFTIIFFISEVIGSSMMITLNGTYVKGIAAEDNVRDSVLINRYIEPKRGDVIVVKHYWDKPKYDKQGNLVTMEYFIKRLIGLEGDRIRFERSGTGTRTDRYTPYRYKLMVNDEYVDEWYLDQAHWGIMAFYGDNIYEYMEGRAQPYPTTDFVPFRDRCVVYNATVGAYEIVVPQGEVFFMGDNRGSDVYSDFGLHSFDGTAFGPQPKNYIEGVKVDKINYQETIPNYIWRKVKQFFSFSWI